MKLIRLGRTEMRVSRVGFGGIPIQRLDHDTAVQVIRRALDLGVNWIDTAHGYGTSEERVGAAIADRDRGGLFIFTKGPARDPVAIREQVQTSLQRLGTDYLDLYQFHNVGSPEGWKTLQTNGTLDVIRRLRDQGVIRHIGASAHTRDAAQAVLGHHEIEVFQFPFNFVVEGDGSEILDGCRRSDTGFIAMKPFGGGVLSDASVCIRFFHQYEDIVLDPGFETVEEVEEVVGLCREEKPLTMGDLEAIAQTRQEVGTRFCRRCGYCMPCPEGVEVRTLMTLESFMRRFPREKVVAQFSQPVASHDNCTSCGECEEKCPYDLLIRETMNEITVQFREYQEATT